jgi:DNA-binding NarL/FixJ family response regulator
MEAKSTKHREKSKILVVDDHPLFREGLVRVLNQEKDLEVCGEAADNEEALKQLAALKPDLILMDITLEGMNGIELTKLIRGRHPKLPILVLSMHKESLYADRALRAGANGYIMKREDGPNLLEAIRQVLQGHVYVSKAVNDAMLQTMASGGRSFSSSPVESLSDREFEIFQLIGEGYGTRQIADEIHLSIKTVETHREHIREKLNLNSTFELVQHAIHWIHAENNER